MTISLSLLNPFGWFNYRAKLSGGSFPGQSSRIGYGGSNAGVAVTPETALQLETYWACVKIIAQTIGTLPMMLYDVQKNGSQKLASDNPLYDILAFQPNADHTATEFWEGVGACLAVWGNAYALKLRSGSRIVGLVLLRPLWMNVFRAPDGSAIYRYTDPLIGQMDYVLDDLMHVRGFGFCDFVGLSPIAFGKDTLGRAIAANDAAGSLFRNGLKLGGFFQYKGTANGGVLNSEQREEVKKALIEPYSGSENAGKIGVLPASFDWVATGINPVDAELMNNRRMSIEEIARSFGVPPILIGHSAEGQTMWGSGVEQIVLAFMTTGLRPYLHRIEAAISRDVIGRANWKTLRAKFDVDELLRGDSKGQAEIDQQLANAGILTRNEIRADRGLPPMVGGDKLTVNSALLPIDMLGKVARLPKDKEVQPGGDVTGSLPLPGDADRVTDDESNVIPLNPKR